MTNKPKPTTRAKTSKYVVTLAVTVDACGDLPPTKSAVRDWLTDLHVGNPVPGTFADILKVRVRSVDFD